MGITERKEREKEHRKEEILDAAEKVFFEKGLQVATMDEIAEVAELGKSTLYLYYKSKEDLYLAVAMRGGEILGKLFENAISKDEPVLRQVQNLGDAYFEYFKSYRNYFRMYYYFEQTDMHKQVSEEVLNSCSQQDGSIWKHVTTPIKRAIDEGIFKPDLDPMQVGVMFWATSNGLMRVMDRQDNKWKEHMGVDLEATLQRALQLMIQGMLTEKGERQYAEVMKETASQ